MTLKKEFEKNADKAWNGLYNRLQEDELLSQDSFVKRCGNKKSVLLGIAAFVAIVLTVSMILTKDSNLVRMEMLTLYNEKGKPTLVTTLEDGSLAFLGDQTSLEYPIRFSEHKREVHLDGDAFFEVSKKQEYPFLIDTKSVIVEVLGTSFNIKAREESSFSLSVRSGKVKVTSKSTRESLYVEGGETAIIDSKKLYVRKTSDIEPFRQYLKHIHFKDHSLSDIIRIVNSNSDSLQIKVAPELEDRRLTVTLSDESVHKMVEYICIALNLQFVQKQNIIYITGLK